MGDEDMADFLIGKRLHEDIDVLVEHRSRVDDRNFAFADNISAGAPEREGARIVCNDPSDIRSQLINASILVIKLEYIWDLNCHVHTLSAGGLFVDGIAGDIQSPRKLDHVKTAATRQPPPNDRSWSRISSIAKPTYAFAPFPKSWLLRIERTSST